MLRRFIIYPTFLGVILLSTSAFASEGYLGAMITMTDDGIVVQKIIPNSPAEEAGLVQDDLILKLDGIEPTDLTAFATEIRDRASGTQISLTILRENREITIHVVLGKTPDY